MLSSGSPPELSSTKRSGESDVFGGGGSSSGGVFGVEACAGGGIESKEEERDDGFILRWDSIDALSPNPRSSKCERPTPRARVRG